MKKRRKEMMRSKLASRVGWVVILVLSLVSLAHLLRLLSGSEIIIGGMVIPLWTSLPGFAGPAILALLFWWSHKR